LKPIYRALLRLYPYDFRFWFGAEMTEAFAASAADTRCAIRELASAAVGCAAEWFAKWTGCPMARSRAIPDLRMMRPAGVSKEDWFGGARGGCSSDT